MSYLGLSNGRWLLAGRRARARHQRLQPARPAPGTLHQGVRAARRRRSRSAPPSCARCGRSACSPHPRSSQACMTCASGRCSATPARTCSARSRGCGSCSRCPAPARSSPRAARRDHALRRAALDLRTRRTDSGAARTRLLGQALMTSHHSDRHAQAPAKTRFIFVTGGVVSSLGKGIAAASIGRLLVSRGLTVGAAEVRPLHQRRPRHDVALPARRGVRHRGRRRDRPGPGPLRALHRRQHQPRVQRHRRRDLRHGHPPRAPRRLPRRHRAGRARTSPTRSSSGSR